MAGIDLKKVDRRSPTQIYLEGIRVAIRYNQENHQFERHPQNNEKIKVLLASTEDMHGAEMALDTVFAQGIDLRLQHATPSFWQHYFNQGLEWPPDALTGQAIYALTGTPDPAKDVSPPVLTHKVDVNIPTLAQRDRVRGTVQLRLVVDSQGVPQRISVARPLGYGLEERAVEAVSKWRFTPAIREGKPVASALLLNLDVELPPSR